MGSETGKNTWKKRKDATPANILLGNNLIRKASDDIKSIFQEFLGGFRSKMIAALPSTDSCGCCAVWVPGDCVFNSYRPTNSSSIIHWHICSSHDLSYLFVSHAIPCPYSTHLNQNMYMLCTYLFIYVYLNMLKITCVTYSLADWLTHWLTDLLTGTYLPWLLYNTIFVSIWINMSLYVRVYIYREREGDTEFGPNLKHVAAGFSHSTRSRSRITWAPTRSDLHLIGTETVETGLSESFWGKPKTAGKSMENVLKMQLI